ncbi:hypothetical protein Hypma_007169 [Hypsizygus marmoreus]|uniref:Integral membrane protein n=1 Tax=Hypsizygus marmoreus TaxID=39966 RepID=A0A369KC32_HYPMA|nr:hypothetical protein Hypma_007169 [Hypsizygus marmoreus]
MLKTGLDVTDVGQNGAGHDAHISRWHHHLHPHVHRHHARNGLPRCVRDLIHPTHVTLTHDAEGDFHWTSRNHRKHRNQRVSPSGYSRYAKNLPLKLARFRKLEYWNISWWVAVTYTFGSIVWVVNGFAVFLPFVSTSFQEAANSVGWTAWVGATIFEIGSILGILEAWNRDDVVDFGWNVERELIFHSEKAAKPPTTWIWFSTDPKFFHELGFLAAFSQLCAATIFWISGWTAIPSIESSISKSNGLLDGVFWTPQVVGGSGFIISSIFIMLETQRKWYLPDPLSLGWHVGFWNFIGAVGFTLCGALGYGAKVSSGVAYQSSLSTFWAGWAFLIGSLIQWYEAVNSI